MRVSLRELILEIKAESHEADPRNVAKLVLDAVQSRDLRDALAETLPEYVRVTMQRDWRIPAIPEASAGTMPPKQRRAAIKDAVARVLDMSVCIDEQNGIWMLYKEMQRDHLRMAGQLKITKGEQSIAAGQRMLMVEQALDDHHVDRVGDLPPDVILATKP